MQGKTRVRFIKQENLQKPFTGTGYIDSYLTRDNGLGKNKKGETIKSVSIVAVCVFGKEIVGTDVASLEVVGNETE